jgi:hypothetical protein
MLQLLYPCSQYRTDKCIFCGGTFQDHLTLWWSKHFYTPLDRYLDRVYQDGVVVRSAETNSGAKLSLSKTTFGYHHRYVLDITHLFDGIQKPREKLRILQRAISQQYKSNITNVRIDQMEQHKWRRLSSQPEIKYVVPHADGLSGVLPLNAPTKTLILWMARDICLDAINKLLDLQAIDHKRTDEKVI